MRTDFELDAGPGWTSCALESHDADEPSRLGATETLRLRAPRSGIVRVVRRFRVPSDRVFAAWLDGASAGRWLFATAYRPILEVDIDPRPGGWFRFVERRRGRAMVYAGRYLEVAPSRRLAFTLAIDARAETTVTIDILPRRDGCALVLVQDPVSSLDRERFAGRWTGILYGLGLALDAATHRHTRS